MCAGRTILVIGDDPVLRDTLVEQLEMNGEFRAIAAESGAAAIALLEMQPVDALLQDRVADFESTALLAALRRAERFAPLLVLVSGEETRLTEALLEAGANDVLAKPFKFGALLARLRSLLKEAETGAIAIGSFGFRPRAKLLVDTSGREIRLTEKETAILEFLYQAGGEMVAREVLLSAVWGYNSGLTTHTLETHIYRLRRKLGSHLDQSELLLTEPGGYRLRHAL